MKLTLLFSLFAMVFATMAQADQGYTRRYKTSYSSFDSSFHTQYSYRETHTRCSYNTCLGSTFESSETVYVQESVVYHETHGRQRMVRVYETDTYEREVVTYYVRNDHRRSRVRARRYNRRHHHYHRHYYYYTPYIMPGLAITSTILDDFDDESAALLIVGAVVTDFGLNVATACRTEECLKAAGVIAAAGIVSSVSASISNSVSESNRRSELERQIAEAESNNSDDVL